MKHEKLKRVGQLLLVIYSSMHVYRDIALNKGALFILGIFGVVAVASVIWGIVDDKK